MRLAHEACLMCTLFLPVETVCVAINQAIGSYRRT